MNNLEKIATLGLVGVGGAGMVFLAGDLSGGFNAASGIVQYGTKTLALVATSGSCLYLGWKKVVKPELHNRAGFITAPIALALTLAVSGVAGYLGIKAANSGIEILAKSQQAVPPAPPSR